MLHGRDNHKHLMVVDVVIAFSGVGLSRPESDRGSRMGLRAAGLMDENADAVKSTLQAREKEKTTELNINRRFLRQPAFRNDLPKRLTFITVCVDQFTKMAHFIPTTVQVTAEETTHLYLRHVFKHHGLPLDIVSDRGPQFTSRLMSTLLELCDIKGN